MMNNAIHIDKKFMDKAILEAQKAELEDEVPVGAVIVKDGKIIAKAHNLKEKKGCANYHAEMIVIAKACKRVGDWRLTDCDLYVTLEPCAMCAGAIINARVSNVFFGAYDKKAGCCGTLYDLLGEGKFNHKPNVVGGVCEKECADILSVYFKQKRLAKKNIEV